MKKQFYYFQLVLIFTIFWIVLFERATPFVLLTAPLISVLSIKASEKFLLKDSYYDLYYFNIFWLIKYSFYLLLEIYKSGLSIIPNIISGHASPEIVEIYTDLDSNLQLALLANSITLTPGTITMDIEGQRLKVLWMDPKTKNITMAGILIKGRLEKLLKEVL
jgi:multicomponent Na+:H+ antiporter subunit E